MTRRQALGWMTSALALPIGCQSVLDSTPSLRLSNWGGAGDDTDFYRNLQRIYKQFERENSVRLRVEGTPNPQDYITKLLLDFVSGSMPDIVTIDASSSAALIRNPALMDINPLVNSDPGFSLTDFNPNVVEIGSFGNSLYSIPIDYTPMVLYCNAKLFREAGVPLPAGKWSFAEFLDKAKALTKGDQFGFEFTNWMPGWVMFLWNNGGDVLDPEGAKTKGFLTSGPSVEAVQFLADLVSVHKVAPNLSQAAATGVDYFANGKAAMKVSGHWYLLTMSSSKAIADDDLVVVELPTNQSDSQTVMYEAGCGIGANCKRPDLAWKFIKFFTSYDVQSLYNSSGVAVSARNDVVGDKLGPKSNLTRAGKARQEVFNEVTKAARSPWGAKVEGYDRVEDHCQKALDAVLKNGVPVAEALAIASTDIDKELAER